MRSVHLPPVSHRGIATVEASPREHTVGPSNLGGGAETSSLQAHFRPVFIGESPGKRILNAKRGVTSDETIEFTSAKGRKQCPHRLRRIGYHDRKTGKDYVFLTTHFHLSAKTIADIYKSRWQVELFFKWIKQNLKVKSFVGTSRNAVMTQVWTAMCIYLILSYIKFANRIAWRLSEILRLLQLNLFERRPLRELLGSGNESPPDRSSQLTMKFTWT